MKVDINENNQSNQIPLISIDISISDDEKATICIMDDDIIEEKIKKFCIQNNLSDFDKELITKKIMQQLEIQINELEQKKISKNNSLNSLKNSFKNNKKLNNIIESSDKKKNSSFFNNNNDFDFNKENNINYVNHYNIDSHYSQNSQKLISNVNTYKNNNYYHDNINNTIENLKNNFEHKNNNKKIKKRNENNNVPIKQISTGQTIYYYSNNENHNDKNIYYYNNNNNNLKNLIEKTKGPEKLYLKYKDQIPKKEAERNKILKEIEDENKKLFKFKPTISENSQIIMKNKYNSNEKIENRLINYGIKKKENDLKLIAKKQFEEEINNSFRPNISEKNNKYKNKIRKKTIEKLSKSFIIDSNNNNILINNKRNKSVGNKNNNKSFSLNNKNLNNINNKKEKKTSFIFHNKIPKPQYKPEKNIHDLLYLQSKLPKENKQIKIEKENFKKNCYFKPKINKSFIIDRNETKEEFIERLYKNNNNNNKIKSLKLNESNNNNKNLFIPKINLRSKNFSQKNLNINYEKIIDKNLHEKNKNENKNNRNNQNKKIFIDHTTEIILKMKIEKYKEIFNLLDYNKNGFISHNKIKISDLNSELLLILTPIFEELQNNKDLKMNFKEFCIKSDKYLSKIIFKNK